MNLIKTISSFFTNKPKDSIPFKDSKYIIKYAFTIGGIEYYSFDDTFNLPYERGLKAISFYEESRMKCSLEYLKLHTEAIDNILNGKSIKIYDIKKLNDQLAERLKFVVDIDLLYKLASVIFFDKDENPSTYEFKYNTEKIEHWKKHKEIGDFFLQMPIVQLMPFLKESNRISPDYAEALRKINRHHLENIYSHISNKEKMSPLDNEQL
jgi:hypothetical protein